MSGLEIVKHIFVIGIKHCGKSTLGRMAAQQLNVSFYDLDSVIEQKVDPTLSTSVRDLYEREGEVVFKKLEAEMACECLDQVELGAPAIIALGGGTVENTDAINCLKGRGKFIYLYEKMEILYDRIMKKGIPPFLSPQSPKEDFRKLYDSRHPECQRIADLTLKLENKDIQEAAEFIINQLKEKGYAR